MRFQPPKAQLGSPQVAAGMGKVAAGRRAVARAGGSSGLLTVMSKHGQVAALVLAALAAARHPGV